MQCDARMCRPNGTATIRLHPADGCLTPGHIRSVNSRRPPWSRQTGSSCRMLCESSLQLLTCCFPTATAIHGHDQQRAFPPRIDGLAPYCDTQHEQPDHGCDNGTARSTFLALPSCFILRTPPNNRMVSDTFWRGLVTAFLSANFIWVSILRCCSARTGKEQGAGSLAVRGVHLLLAGVSCRSRAQSF